MGNTGCDALGEFSVELRESDLVFEFTEKKLLILAGGLWGLFENVKGDFVRKLLGGILALLFAKTSELFTFVGSALGVPDVDFFLKEKAL